MKNLINNTCFSLVKSIFFLFNFTIMFNKKRAALLLASCCMLFSCNNKTAEKNREESTLKDSTPKKTTQTPLEAKPPTINIFDTIIVPKIVICMKDSSASFEGIGQKLAIMYAKIGKDVLAKNKLTPTAQPMAWYKSEKAPYFFEAGIAVTKAPAKLPSGMYIKQIKTDSATIAHFYGPYSLLFKGYDAIKERMHDQKKSAKGKPYEIYVSDPIDASGKLLDAYKVRTDIVFPWH